MKIVLASASPRRQEMLRDLGIDYETLIPDVPEIWTEQAPVAKTAIELARKKASKYAGKNALVIAMDTIVAINRKKLGKPQNVEEARAMLQFLSGRTHNVVTGTALRRNGRIVTGVAITKVQFRRLSSDEINWYLQSGEPFDKAGAYAIQGLGRVFINKIEGCYYNVVGFPLTLFQRLLAKWNLTILDLQSLSRNS